MNAVVNLLIDHGYLEEIRRDMIKFAHLQLRDEAQAEDVVRSVVNNRVQRLKRPSVYHNVFA